MAGLMGDHLHIVLRAVEVGKDEGHFIVAQTGAVAAGPLALGAQHVQQLVVQHGAEELLRLRRQFAVELHALGQDVVRRAHRPGIAGAELQRRVREAQGIALAQPLRLLAVDLLRHRHEVLPHGGAELLHVVLGVAVALHAVVAQGGVALVAQLSAHGVTQVHQLVVQGVQLLRVLHGPLGVRFPRRQTALVVQIGLHRLQLGQGIGFSLEGYLRRGDELLIRLDQVVLLLHLRDDLRGEALAVDLRVEEHQLAVLRGEVLAERGSQHRRLPRLLVLLQLRPEGIPEFLLAVVKGVAGVDRVTNGSQRGLGLRRAGQRLLLQKGRPGLLIGGRVLQPLRQRRPLLLEGLRVGALIGHLRKLHSQFLLMSRGGRRFSYCCRL